VKVSEKTMARLLKVFELHKRGVDGEAENATSLLSRLLKENDLTMADLEDGHDVRMYSFPARNRNEQRLLAQILFKVIPDYDGTFCRGKGSSKREYELTPAQHAEVSVMYSLYREDMKKTMERAFLAFIQANQIYSGSSSDDREHTPEEIAEIRKMLAMAEGIEPTQVRKQIG